MSLTASMWTSVSGLLAHGEKMNVIGNNISNVNTVAYKSQRMDFQDFVYQYTGTANGLQQVGKGTAIGAVMNDFSQGSMETTTSSTDIAIEGNGFFSVRPRTNNATYYTRAGNFSFNNQGELVDANGYVLQGWKINQNSNGGDRNSSGIVGAGAPVDIRLQTFTCPPKHTNNISLPVNLRNSKIASNDDKSTDETDPFFALLKTWDASQTKALSTNQAAYQSTMNVYDEAGKMHTLTIYFDRVANGYGGQNITGNTDGESYWEFIVTMNPNDDVRDFNSSFNFDTAASTTPNVPERLKGLLGAGAITFNSSGTMTDMTAFVPHSDPADPTDQWWTGDQGKETIDLSKWIAAPINKDGFPVVAPNFSGTAGQQLAHKDGQWIGINPDTDGRTIAIDLGLKINDNQWNFITGPKIPDSAQVTLTDGPLTADGKPLGPGGAKALDLGGPLYDSSSWTTPGVQRVVNGSPLTLYLVDSTVDGMPATYYTTEAPATGSGITVSQSWPVMDPAKPSLDAAATNSSGTPLGSGGAPLDLGKTPFYTEDDLGAGNAVRRKDPDNPSDDLALYLITDAADATKKFFIKQNDLATYQANASYTVDATPIYIADPKDQPLPNTDMLDSNGKPLTALPPAELNIGGPVYDASQLPTEPYPPMRRKDASGKEMTLYLIDNTTDNNKPALYYSLTAPADATTIRSATPLWGPDPRVIHNGNTGNPVSAADMGSSKYHINGTNNKGETLSYATTSLGDSFYDQNGAKQDGYAHGNLRDVSVGANGVLSASYSNGQTLQLYQIVLYDFPSLQGLRMEGGNLYSETLESGPPSSGAAGTGSFGTTRGFHLEQSNADISREFVNMITTQRGFQANSKTITTVDTMLETVISMKR